MVEWLAGNRIRGTSTERTTGAGFNPADAVSGGWKEVGRTTLGSAGDIIDVTSLPDKRYYMVLYYVKNDDGNAINCNNRFNSDTGTNYRFRSNSSDGGGEYTPTSQTSLSLTDGSGSPHLVVEYIANKSDKEKLTISHVIRQRNSGAGNAPSRSEVVGKWVNTSSSISSLSANNAGAGSYASGSEVVVLGWDPADTHTTNFWEELATNTASGGGSTQEVTFTAKKYLWFQCYFELSGSTDIPRFQVGNGSFDTGNNYAERFSGNGGTDETQINRSDIHIDKASSKPFFVNGFIINNASQEKLFIIHSVEQNTAGAGNAPTRIENVGKWTNTSNQIDRLRTTFGTDTINAGAIMKVWGSN